MNTKLCVHMGLYKFICAEHVRCLKKAHEHKRISNTWFTCWIGVLRCTQDYFLFWQQPALRWEETEQFPGGIQDREQAFPHTDVQEDLRAQFQRLDDVTMFPKKHKIQFWTEIMSICTNTICPNYHDTSSSGSTYSGFSLQPRIGPEHRACFWQHRHWSF